MALERLKQISGDFCIYNLNDNKMGITDTMMMIGLGILIIVLTIGVYNKEEPPR